MMRASGFSCDPIGETTDTGFELAQLGLLRRGPLYLKANKPLSGALLRDGGTKLGDYRWH